MGISITCPRCKAAFTVAHSQAGKSAYCPKCNAFTRVPDVELELLPEGEEMPAAPAPVPKPKLAPRVPPQDPTAKPASPPAAKALPTSPVPAASRGPVQSKVSPPPPLDIALDELPELFIEKDDAKAGATASVAGKSEASLLPTAVLPLAAPKYPFGRSISWKLWLKRSQFFLFCFLLQILMLTWDVMRIRTGFLAAQALIFFGLTLGAWRAQAVKGTREAANWKWFDTPVEFLVIAEVFVPAVYSLYNWIRYLNAEAAVRLIEEDKGVKVVGRPIGSYLLDLAIVLLYFSISAAVAYAFYSAAKRFEVWKSACWLNVGLSCVTFGAIFLGTLFHATAKNPSSGGVERQLSKFDEIHDASERNSNARVYGPAKTPPKFNTISMPRITNATAMQAKGGVRGFQASAEYEIGHMFKFQRYTVFLPVDKRPDRTLPCLFMARFNGFDSSKTEEFEARLSSYARKGFAVVGYMIPDNPLTKRSLVGGNDLHLSSDDVIHYYHSYLGAAQGRDAVNFALGNVSEVDPQRLYAVGWDDLGMAALRLAQLDSRISGCAVVASRLDAESIFGESLERASNLAPDLLTLVKGSSPRSYAADLKAPLYLLYPGDLRDAAPENLTGFVDSVRSVNSDVTLDQSSVLPDHDWTRADPSLLNWLTKVAKPNPVVELKVAWTAAPDPRSASPTPARTGIPMRTSLHESRPFVSCDPATPYLVDKPLLGDKLELWNYQKGVVESTFTVPGFSAYSSEGQHLTLTPDGKHAAMAFVERALLLAVVPTHDSGDSLAVTLPSQPQSSAWSQFVDNDRLAVVQLSSMQPGEEDRGAELSIWSMSERTTLVHYTFRANDKWNVGSRPLAVSPGGKFVAVAARDRIHLVNSGSGKVEGWCVASRSGNRDLGAIAFTQDGKFLAHLILGAAYLSQNSFLNIYDMKDGSLYGSRRIGDSDDRLTTARSNDILSSTGDGKGWLLDQRIYVPAMKGNQACVLSRESTPREVRLLALLPGYKALVSASHPAHRIVGCELPVSVRTAIEADDNTVDVTAALNKAAIPELDEPLPERSKPLVKPSPKPVVPPDFAPLDARISAYLDKTYRSLVVIGGEPLTDSMKLWAPGKKPVIGLRWGLGVTSANQRLFLNDVKDLEGITGPIGPGLLDRLNSGVAAGKYGQWPAPPTSDVGGVANLGAGSNFRDLLPNAKKYRVDLALLIDVTIQVGALGKTREKILKFSILDMVSGTVKHTAEPLSESKFASLGEEGANKYFADLLARADEIALIREVPDLPPEKVKLRAASLVETPPSDPLRTLAELRFYQVKGWLTEAEAATLYGKILGGDKGKQLASGDEAQRREAIGKVVSVRRLQGGAGWEGAAGARDYAGRQRWGKKGCRCSGVS